MKKRINEYTETMDVWFHERYWFCHRALLRVHLLVPLCWNCAGIILCPWPGKYRRVSADSKI